MHPWALLPAAVVGLFMLARPAAAAVPAGGDRSVSGQPRGIRNHNPGNLRPVREKPWRGQVGVDSSNYLIFESADYGLRAMGINLLNQQRLHKLSSLRAIFTKYAPPEENDTNAYVAAMARALGVGPDDPVELLHDRVAFEKLVRAVIKHENGVQPYDDETIAAGVRAAYAGIS